ncbi:MAG: DUF222 domain-containing protein [Pseudolysinimonas sp.]
MTPPTSANAAATDVFVPQASADLFDAVAEVERVIASLTGIRARMIDRAHDWVREHQASLPTSRGPSHDRRFAHEIVVAELAAVLRIPANSAARLVGESRTLVADLPATLEALGHGDISYRHAEIVIDNADAKTGSGGGSSTWRRALFGGRLHSVARTSPSRPS